MFPLNATTAGKTGGRKKAGFFVHVTFKWFIARCHPNCEQFAHSIENYTLLTQLKQY